MSNFNDLLVNEQFIELFVGIGWDRVENVNETIQVEYMNSKYNFSPIGQKRGYHVFHCRSDEYVNMNNMGKRRLYNLFSQLTPCNDFFIIVSGYDSSGCKYQEWAVMINHRYYSVCWYHNQNTQILIEKLQYLAFEYTEESKIHIRQVGDRVNQAFMANSEKVTATFYRNYTKLYSLLVETVIGISCEKEKERFSISLLNRIMFLYFLQRKGCLDHKQRYFKEYLSQHNNKKISFYKNFLEKLFYEALNVKIIERKHEVKILVGDVPYLNGDLFLKTTLESQSPDIDIPNSTIEEIFKFLDKYKWHLDDRVTSSGTDISPEILGYIFERYINEKTGGKVGAYYTKEDITDHMVEKSVVTNLVSKIDMKAVTKIWKILMIRDPNRYIPSGLRYGFSCEIINKYSKSLSNSEDASLVNIPAKVKEDIMLTGEENHELISRFCNYIKLTTKLKNCDLNNIYSLMAENVDVHTLLLDYIHNEADHCKIKAILNVLMGDEKNNIPPTTIVDPACGSGAFILSSLNVLYDIYEACLIRLSNDECAPVIDQYWITKKIILTNLYGVDIMDEAVEIAKLRLFLRLAGLVSIDNNKVNMGITPLPDIDFNIITGNSLVGFVSHREIKKLITKDLSAHYENKIRNIENKIKKVDTMRIKFKLVQLNNEEDMDKLKSKLTQALNDLDNVLNDYYLNAVETFQSNQEKADQYNQLSVKPFHWLLHYYEVIEKYKGFDIVIGNPPYVESNKVKGQYSTKRFGSKPNNLYTFFIQQSYELVKPNGVVSLIVPLSLTKSIRTSETREVIMKNSNILLVTNFGDCPSSLFTGAHQKITIFLSQTGTDQNFYFSTSPYAWAKYERGTLFDLINYTSVTHEFDKNLWYKVGNQIDKSILNKISNQKNKLSDMIKKVSSEESKADMFLADRLCFWIRCFSDIKPTKEYKGWITIHKDVDRKAIVALLNSNLFFWFWDISSDGWHLTNNEICRFGVNLSKLKAQNSILSILTDDLMNDLLYKRNKINTAQSQYEYRHRLSKIYIDRIDEAVAYQYALSATELNYIKSYKSKYRLAISQTDA